MLLLIIALLVCSLSGCGVSAKLPDNPIVFEVGENEESYLYLSFEDRIYVPYCPYKSVYLGNCIGYYDTISDGYSDSIRCYVYGLKGYSSDEWIVDYLPTINEGMIYREINTVNIPEELESEYEWNQ